MRATPFTVIDEDWRPNEQGRFHTALVLEVERDDGFVKGVGRVLRDKSHASRYFRPDAS